MKDNYKRNRNKMCSNCIWYIEDYDICKKCKWLKHNANEVHKDKEVKER